MKITTKSQTSGRMKDQGFSAEKLKKAMEKLHKEIPPQRLKEYFDYHETTGE